METITHPTTHLAATKPVVEAAAPEIAEGERNRILYGFIAEFEHAEDLLDAAHKARDAGYKRMDAFAPFPLEGLSEAMGFRDFYVPAIMLVGGIVGCFGGFGFLTWCTVDQYPINIGGRPLFGWPSFIPITFEITVLLSALSGIIGMLVLNGLPQPYHPVFNAPNFVAASSDRFFLCIEAKDRKFDREETRKFMEGFRAARVSEVIEEH